MRLTVTSGSQRLALFISVFFVCWFAVDHITMNKIMVLTAPKCNLVSPLCARRMARQWTRQHWYQHQCVGCNRLHRSPQDIRQEIFPLGSCNQQAQSTMVGRGLYGTDHTMCESNKMHCLLRSRPGKSSHIFGRWTPGIGQHTKRARHHTLIDCSSPPPRWPLKSLLW